MISDDKDHKNQDHDEFSAELGEDHSDDNSQAMDGNDTEPADAPHAENDFKDDADIKTVGAEMLSAGASGENARQDDDFPGADDFSDIDDDLDIDEGSAFGFDAPVKKRKMPAMKLLAPVMVLAMAAGAGGYIIMNPQIFTAAPAGTNAGGTSAPDPVFDMSELVDDNQGRDAQAPQDSRIAANDMNNASDVDIPQPTAAQNLAQENTDQAASFDNVNVPRAPDSSDNDFQDEDMDRGEDIAAEESMAMPAADDFDSEESAAPAQKDASLEDSRFDMPEFPETEEFEVVAMNDDGSDADTDAAEVAADIDRDDALSGMAAEERAESHDGGRVTTQASERVLSQDKATPDVAAELVDITENSNQDEAVLSDNDPAPQMLESAVNPADTDNNDADKTAAGNRDAGDVQAPLFPDVEAPSAVTDGRQESRADSADASAAAENVGASDQSGSGAVPVPRPTPDRNNAGTRSNNVAAAQPDAAGPVSAPEGTNDYYDSSSVNIPRGPAASIGPRKIDPKIEPASRFVVVKQAYDKNDQESMLVAANRALKLERYNAALEMFNKLADKNDRDSRILMGQAIAQQNLGLTESAIQSYERVLDIDPQNASAMLNMLGLLRTQYPQVALRRLMEIHEDYPSHAGVAAQIGVTEADLGNYQEAIRYLDMASSLEPQNPQHYFNLAIIAERAGNVRQAIHNYEQALQIDSVHKGARALPRETIYDRLSTLRRRL